MSDQTITIVGAGGLGSVIAENLVHSGFQSLNLIDHDRVEPTNLNRLVGATHNDAIQGRLKVDVVRDHLQRINPDARITAYPFTVESPQATLPLMQADWIILATDSHASRFFTQAQALELGIPLLSAGVNISVSGGTVVDESGEVIIAATATTSASTAWGASTRCWSPLKARRLAPVGGLAQEGIRDRHHGNRPSCQDVKRDRRRRSSRCSD
jgi:hypothetical protein